jgi:hypothetical protein
VRPVRIDGHVLKTLTDAVKSLQRQQEGKTRSRELPMWLPNGEPITTVAQMAAMLNTSEKTAAAYVMESKIVGPLRREAKDVYNGMSGVPRRPHRAAPDIIERPGAANQGGKRKRRRKRTLTEVKES